MTNAETPAGQRELVTLDVTDHDVYAVLVNALRAAAADAREEVERAPDDDVTTAQWVEHQERGAQIALALVQSVEEQIDAHSLARIQRAREADTDRES